MMQRMICINHHPLKKSGVRIITLLCKAFVLTRLTSFFLALQGYVERLNMGQNI